MYTPHNNTFFHLRKYFTFAVLLLAVFCLNSSSLFSQFLKNTSVSSGIYTIGFINSLTNDPFISNYTASLNDIRVGAGLSGSNLGAGATLLFDIDTNKRFTVPMGFEYYPLRSTELRRLTDAYQRNDYSVNLSDIFLGIDYAVLRYSKINAKLYTGLDARFVFVGKNKMVITNDYIKGDSSNTSETTTKDASFRIGGSVYAGIQGEIQKNWFVNFKASIGVLNLFFRDNARGYLLTPTKINELDEPYLTFYNLYFQVQYKF